MKTFTQWLNEADPNLENSLRTSLGIYPPSYGAGQYPPSYFMPISATAANSLKRNHPETLKNTNPKPKKNKTAK